MISTLLRYGTETREIRLDGGSARIGDRSVEFEAVGRNGALAEVKSGGRRHRVAVAVVGDRILVWCDGAVFRFEKPRAAGRTAGAEHAGDLISPMPGRVRRTLAAAGDAVARGQVLLVLEAMKMEHAIRAPRDGILLKLLVREGDLVDAGVELAEIGPPPADG